MEEVYGKKNVKMIGYYSSDLDCIIDGKDIVFEYCKNMRIIVIKYRLKIKIWPLFVYSFLDPALMLVPIDERMINRAHGVFDSMGITKYRFFRVENIMMLVLFNNSSNADKCFMISSRSIWRDSKNLHRK